MRKNVGKGYSRKDMLFGIGKIQIQIWITKWINEHSGLQFLKLRRKLTSNKRKIQKAF